MSGAVTKLSAPADVIAILASPLTLKVIVSKSVARIVPIEVVFSRIVKVDADVNTGAVVSTTLTVLVAVPALPEASVDV